MTKSTALLISGFSLIASVYMTPAFSATIVEGGVIHFRGAIVADPCEITPQHRQFVMSCPENNRIQTRTVSYEDALNGRSAYPGLTTVSMQYLNPEKTLAVVKVEYR
ncbi:type 1 fimbrial protein [Enterobacter mori]|uniref:type 1 fimbrial protein n=1 Tax=Enterobacter mori TaxID=539813 RepID=UPI0021B0B826|nr:type 1 fimbrial protein [Enterobacter mori]UWX94859.1 type 1 fimbrial protein [Enterobacter mori]